MTRPATAILGVLVLAAAHAVAVGLSLGVAERVRTWHDLAGWVASAVALVGAWLGATTFVRGDYLRRVWGWFAAAAFLLLVGTALKSHWMHVAPGRPFSESPLAAHRMVVVTAANAAATYAWVLLVLTFRRAGLRAPWTARFASLWAAAAAAALAIAIPQILDDVRSLAEPGGASSAITSMASTLGDTATIVLVVPILRVAYLMRRGRLAWPWWTMGLSGVVWLIYDVKDRLAVFLPGDEAANLALIQTLRTPGLALLGLAGFLQREAVKQSTPSQRMPAAVR